ncbi:DUF1517 domain-containing protein [Altericista sp. CCNU0014]|uniref:DUF1517 domain-containing protein n=1 Tax=Altericista sp. CCNU0014 TaxID=3082949 RepID=UPI00384EDC8D
MAPSRQPISGPSGYGYGGGYGGGFGFPFLLPFMFGGGGSLFTILIFIALANFIFSSFRNAASSEGGVPVSEQDLTNPPVSVNTLQIGLLAEARALQTDLDRIALNADTSNSAGLAEALQESTLALLRHPEYWIYASAEGQQTRLMSAEAEFNRRTLSERSKFQEETLSNYSAQLKQKSTTATLPAEDSASALLKQGPGEYILVTLIVASQGKLELPKIRSAQDLQRALGQMGGVGAEDLLAMRVLWTPQAEGDALTSDDLLAAYPNLQRI